jgi:hypothetical protein
VRIWAGSVAGLATRPNDFNRCEDSQAHHTVRMSLFLARRVAAQEFLKFKEARNGTESLKILPKCANEALMIVEADKLLRIYDKAEAAVRSIMKKINATISQ